MPLPLIWTKIIPFGRRAEIAGCEYVRELGYRILASPYRVAGGEVDIVALDGDTLVFIEVKARSGDPRPEDAVNLEKRRRLVRAARSYRRGSRHRGASWRYDILAVVEPEGERPRFRLLPDAFREPSDGDFPRS